MKHCLAKIVVEKFHGSCCTRHRTHRRKPWFADYVGYEHMPVVAVLPKSGDREADGGNEGVEASSR